MNCPVCDETLNAQVTVCSNCGFDELHKEFADENERDRWLKETVEPCRKVFEKCARSFAGMQEIATFASDLFFSYVKDNLLLVTANKLVYWKLEEGIHSLIDSYNSEFENGVKAIERKYKFMGGVENEN